MIKFTESDFAEVYKESCHFREMTDLDLFTEFVKVKTFLYDEYADKPGAINLTNTVKRFLSTGKKEFEDDKRNIEKDIPNYILRMANRCDDSFTVQDLKTYLFSFFSLLNKQNEEVGMSYDKLKAIFCEKLGTFPIDFTQGVKFETLSDNGIEKKVLRKSKLPYPVSLDLFLSAILSEKHADLHLEKITQKELAKLKQDFETCLKNMKEAAEIESEKS